MPAVSCQAPSILYNNDRVHVSGGSWNMVPRNKPGLKFLAPAVGKFKWSCLYIEAQGLHPQGPPVRSGRAESAVGGLRQDPQGNRPQRRRGFSTGEQGGGGLLGLQGYRRRLPESCDRRVQMVFVILPATMSPIYNCVKKLGDLHMGVHTVCSVGQKLAKQGGQDQYMRNLALKFNLKLGGVNHMVDGQRLASWTRARPWWSAST